MALQVSQMIQNVLQLKLITKEMALQKLKPFFPFSSADDVLEAIEEEQEEQAPLSESQEQETMKSNANDSLQKEEPPASSPAKSNPF
jgi:FtsZ-interacting cell division protein YlmF